MRRRRSRRSPRTYRPAGRPGGRRDLLGRIGIPRDVALRAMTEPPLELVGVRCRRLGQRERERMARACGRSGLIQRAGSLCSASCQRPIRSKIELIDRGDSRPPGRRDATLAADKNTANESPDASLGRSCSSSRRVLSSPTTRARGRRATRPVTGWQCSCQRRASHPASPVGGYRRGRSTRSWSRMGAGVTPSTATRLAGSARCAPARSPPLVRVRVGRDNGDGRLRARTAAGHRSRHYIARYTDPPRGDRGVRQVDPPDDMFAGIAANVVIPRPPARHCGGCWSTS